MKGVTMCSNEDCKMKDSCFRFNIESKCQESYLSNPEHDCVENGHILYIPFLNKDDTNE